MSQSLHCHNKIYIWGGNQAFICSGHFAGGVCCGGFLHLNHRQTWLLHKTLLWVKLNFSFWTTRKFGLSTTFHFLTFLYWFTVHCLFQCCFCTNITLPHSFLPFWIIGKVWFPRRGLSKASNQCNAPNPEVSLRQLHHQHKQLCRLINITLNIINRPPRPIFFRCDIDSIS